MSALLAWPDDDSAPIGEAAGYKRRFGRLPQNPTLAIQIRGKFYQTLNWSIGGMLIGDYDGALGPGDTFDIDGIGLAGGKNWPVLIHTRVIRTGGESGMELAAQFLTISAPAYDILEGILMRRPGYRSAA